MPTVTTQLAPGMTARPKAAGLFAPRTLLSDVFSFEMVYLAFFFSNQFELILPKLPIDLTVLFFGLTLVLGAVVVAREGIYLPGLLLVTALLPWLAWVNLSAMWTPSRTLVWEYLKIVNTVNLWCLIASAMIVAHKRERMLRFLKLMIAFSVLIALLGDPYLYYLWLFQVCWLGRWSACLQQLGPSGRQWRSHFDSARLACAIIFDSANIHWHHY